MHHFALLNLISRFESVAFVNLVSVLFVSGPDSVVGIATELPGWTVRGLNGGPGSVVSIATGYGLDGPGFEWWAR
jgi:hypothetical protein